MYGQPFVAQRPAFTSEVAIRPIESHQRKRRNIGVLENEDIFTGGEDFFPQARAHEGDEIGLPIQV